MDRQTSSLLIKSNRVLGTRLVEAGLTSVEEMDKANETFIEFARAKDIRRASLLRVLLYDSQAIREESLLDYQLEHFPVGAVMLENYLIDEQVSTSQPLEIMRASWTLPIDFVGGRWFLATAYYMSDIVRNYWEEKLEGRITWYISPMNQLETFFEKRAGEEEQALGGEVETEKSEA